MADQPSSDNPARGPVPDSPFRDLAFVMTVVAGAVVVGQGWPIGQEVYRNLEGGAAAWLVCGVLLAVGAVIVWAALGQVSARLKRTPNQPARKGRLVGMFAAVLAAGVIGSALGRSLAWRLKWTAGVYLEGGPGEWEEVQGWVGWALATSVVVTVWGVTAQLLADRRKA